ncbi:sugar-binding transcriptional regulator [Amaricoccus tamworthensis]|uniref:sugar-binding transcriptional regulator n=1 Tax=Amaricoccus tamworthensis TaxID=57002 RepID=UPI003C79E6FD
MSSQKQTETEISQLDEAARAAWLYYVGGKTQDQIAKELGISRQRAQRLVSRAVAEGIIHFRLDHAIGRCLEIERKLRQKHGLKVCRVAPWLGEGVDPVPGIAPLAAVEIERVLSSADPVTIAVGTGRTLRAAVEELTRMDCPRHRLVSLNGNISPDGSASHYDVIMRIGDRVRAPHFPMPVPAVASSKEEKHLFHSLKPVQRTMELARNADVTFVGIGQVDETAPLVKDGFITADELAECRKLGAAGEIAGWIYDETGKYLDTGPNLRMTGQRVDPPQDSLVVGVAAGASKVRAFKSALNGGLVNGLVTDEATAIRLLD